MACFPSASDVPSGETFNASNGFSYTGGWTTKQDSQQRTYLVSTTGEDMATTEFKDAQSVQVSGRIDPQGINVFFGLDDSDDVDPGTGGSFCQSSANPTAQETNRILYDSGQLSPGVHRLFVINKGLPLSLYQFNIIDASGKSTSTPNLPTSSATVPTTSPSTLAPSTSGFGSVLSTSNGGSTSPRTSLSTTLPTISDLQSHSTVTPSGSLSLNVSSSAVDVSSFTEVTTIGGNTTTIVVQTTIEGRPGSAPRSHSQSAGPIAGAVVGGVVFLLLLVGAGLWWRRRRRSLLQSPNDKSGLERHITPHATTLATKGIHSLGPPDVTPAQEPVTESRSQEDPRPSTGDEASQSCAASDRESDQALDPNPPEISSTIAEHSLVLDGNSSGAAANAATELPGLHSAVARANAKIDSGSTPADVPLPDPGPQRSAGDATIAHGSTMGYWKYHSAGLCNSVELL